MSGWKNSSDGRRNSTPRNYCDRCGSINEKRAGVQIIARSTARGQKMIAQRSRTVCEPCAQEVFALATDSLLKDAS